MDSQDDALRLMPLTRNRYVLKKAGEIAQTKLMPSLMKKLTICMKKNFLAMKLLSLSWTHFGLTIPYILDWEVWVSITI